MTKKTLFSTVFDAAQKADIYHATRDRNSIFNHAMSEMGEIALEINIANGQSYKEAGPDGIVGEALDAIASLLDLIYIENPDITEEELVQKLQPKMHKWVDKIAEHSHKN
jgi:hypothetical protein